MSSLPEAIQRHARSAAKDVALEGDGLHLSYAVLHAEVAQCATRLANTGIRRLGLLMDNSPTWAIVDLAALDRQIVLVPLPEFFTDTQLKHVIQSVGLDAVLTDKPARLLSLLPDARLRPWPRIVGRDVWQLTLPVSRQVALPENTVKITFTSGTTGQPKGVCLTEKTIHSVTRSLAQVLNTQLGNRHLTLLPLAVLLENIAGLYVALWRGVTCNLTPMEQLGVQGASGLDALTMFSHVANEQASSIILIPQMLQAMLTIAEQGMPFPALQFAAVGGASVAPQLLQHAQNMGLPVYEGYGLSECASVVSVNCATNQKPGSVGKPLPHIKLQIAGDGEILVAGPRYAGYLGDDTTAHRSALLPTGDLGYLDEEGYLYITGRKKHVYITSFGRNVSPEWIERELTACAPVAQAVVFGEGRHCSTALLVLRQQMSSAEIDNMIRQANSRLPDYARIGHWLLADEAFSPANHQFTTNGRPRRDVIWQHYSDRINQFYERQAVNA